MQLDLIDEYKRMIKEEDYYQYEEKCNQMKKGPLIEDLFRREYGPMSINSTN